MSVLTQIQSELKAPKSQYNNFGKYYYRTLSDIDEALKPLLLKYNAEVHLSDKIVSVGNRIYVEATATFKCKEETITVTAYAREDESKKGMDGAQVTGGSSSYARKYALNGLFLIDDTKDIDSEENQQQPAQNNQQGQASNQQVQHNQVKYIDNTQYQEILKTVEEFATVKGAPFDIVANFVLNKYQIPDFHQVPVDGYNVVMKYLNTQIQKAYSKQGE